MRAVLVDKAAPANLSLGEAEEPTPAPSEALVRVSAISLNRGEVRRAQMAEPGFNPGWDLAGTVEQRRRRRNGSAGRCAGRGLPPVWSLGRARRRADALFSAPNKTLPQSFLLKLSLNHP